MQHHTSKTTMYSPRPYTGAFLEKSSGGSSSRAEGPHLLYIAHVHITPVYVTHNYTRCAVNLEGIAIKSRPSEAGRLGRHEPPYFCSIGDLSTSFIARGRMTIDTPIICSVSNTDTIANFELRLKPHFS